MSVLVFAVCLFKRLLCDNVKTHWNVYNNKTDNMDRLQKMWICLTLLKKAKRKKQDTAKEFGIPVSTLATIIINKYEILKSFSWKLSNSQKKWNLENTLI